MWVVFGGPVFVKGVVEVKRHLTETHMTDRTHHEGSILVPPSAKAQLHLALEQMDLLLASQDVEAGLVHLVALLRYLRAFRREMH